MLRIENRIRETGITMNQFLSLFKELSENNPDREYYFDGDLYALVSKPRCC